MNLLNYVMSRSVVEDYGRSKFVFCRVCDKRILGLDMVKGCFGEEKKTEFEGQNILEGWQIPQNFPFFFFLQDWKKTKIPNTEIS